MGKLKEAFDSTLRKSKLDAKTLFLIGVFGLVCSATSGSKSVFDTALFILVLVIVTFSLFFISEVSEGNANND